MLTGIKGTMHFSLTTFNGNLRVNLFLKISVVGLLNEYYQG